MPDPRAGALLTADEFFQLTSPEGERRELLDGVVVVSPRPSLWHRELAAVLRHQDLPDLAVDLTVLFARGGALAHQGIP